MTLTPQADLFAPAKPSAVAVSKVVVSGPLAPAPERPKRTYTAGPHDKLPRQWGYREYTGRDRYHRITDPKSHWRGYTNQAVAEIRALSERGLITSPVITPW